MAIRILLISDIHGNFPALQAVDRKLDSSTFDHIINCGDSLVYAPFPNDTLAWLGNHKALSILGNTDRKVIKLLRGKSFKKPGKHEKRIMYSSTADSLNKKSKEYLLSLPKTEKLKLLSTKSEHSKKKLTLCVYHGSPADQNEFLFTDTPESRFRELAIKIKCSIIVTGHSHSPYHKKISGVHFINPGSIGRMFDGDPRASCATIEITSGAITVTHHRIEYEIEKVVTAIRLCKLPEIYAAMYLQGRKLN